MPVSSVREVHATGIEGAASTIAPQQVPVQLDLEAYPKLMQVIGSSLSGVPVVPFGYDSVVSC